MQQVKTVNEIAAMRPRITNLYDVLEARGIANFRPSDELLRAFSAALGEEYSARWFHQKFSGKSPRTMEDAVVFSAYFDIPLDAMCSLEHFDNRDSVAAHATASAKKVA